MATKLEKDLESLKQDIERLRSHLGSTLSDLGSLSHDIQSVSVPTPFRRSCLDLLSSATVSVGAELVLAPYSYLWLQVPSGD